MRILVTGGAGYIGSVLVPMLLGEGHEVTVIDRFMYRQTPLLDCCHEPGFELVRGDARDRNLIAASLESADVVFPLACLTGAPLCEKEPDEARSVNLDAVQMILDLKSRDQRVIFPTTNSGYGIGQEGIYCTEETPLRPISTYGRQKVEAEKRVLAAGSSITLRLATAFGISPRMRLDLLVNDFVYRAVTAGHLTLFQGHFKRNYIHVRDVARAFLFALEHFDSMRGRPYNVGLSSANLSKRELCTEIQKQVPKFVFSESTEGEDPDKRNYIVSNERIEQAGFSPRTSLQAGITELIKGYRVISTESAERVYANA